MAKSKLSPEERAEKRKAYQREYRRTHAEQHRAASRESYEARKAKVGAERFLAERRAWNAAHPDKVRAYEANRTNRAARRVAAIARIRKWHKEHPEAVKAIRKRHYERHREKILARAMKKHWANRERELVRFWRNGIKRRYGVTVEQYEQMAASGCNICGAEKDVRETTDKKRKHRLSVDHDKTTGKVRGVLCGNCNAGIGLFNHDREQLLKAIAYLERTASS